MSFWVLTCVDEYEPQLTKPAELYKTEDEAIDKCITNFYGDELYETPDGNIWFQSDEFTGLPIELKYLREHIKMSGFLDKMDVMCDDILNCREYYIITEMKLTKSSKMVTCKVELLTEEKKCLNCKKNFEIHRFDGPEIIKFTPCCTRCRDCNSTGDLSGEFADKWYCLDICKQSKHKQLFSEKENEELRRPGKNFHGPPGSKKQATLKVEHYRDFNSGKSKAFRLENCIILVERGDDLIAIGSDDKNDGFLKMISTIKDYSFLEEIEIDEGWRKGNKEPVLFSDYLKIISQEKN